MDYDVPPEMDPQQKFMFMLLERITALEKRESERHIVRDVMNVRANDADYIEFATKQHDIATNIVEAMKRGENHIVLSARNLSDEEWITIVDDLKRREFTVKKAYLSQHCLKYMVIKWKGTEWPKKKELA
jgi:predicted dinucleotide-utilizing enzyme